MNEIKNFNIIFESNTPINPHIVGNSYGLYIPKTIYNNLLNKTNIVYPLLVLHNGKVKISFYLTLPKDFEDRCYKVYKLQRKKQCCIYIPLPKHLVSVLFNNKRKCLLSYKIAEEDGKKLILVERFEQNP